MSDAGVEQEKNNPTTSNESGVASGWYVYMRDFLCSRKCQSLAKLTEKTVIITGGNTGIGKETALDLSKRGAKVIIACRDIEKGEKAVSDIQNKFPEANVRLKKLDLASFSSIRKFANEILETEPFIHILINNAGIAGCSKSATEEGFEMQFGVNHLGHFLLTSLLLERIKSSAPARIINVSSVAHIYGKIDFKDINLDHNYKPLQAYGRSKLANILFTRELAKRLEGTGVTVYCLHPGAVHTGLGQHLNSSINSFTGILYDTCSRLFWKSTYKGAQTVIYCAVEGSLINESGHYYCDCSRIQPSARGRDDELAKKLWNVSEELISKANK